MYVYNKVFCVSKAVLNRQRCINMLLRGRLMNVKHSPMQKSRCPKTGPRLWIDIGLSFDKGQAKYFIFLIIFFAVNECKRSL